MIIIHVLKCECKIHVVSRDSFARKKVYLFVCFVLVFLDFVMVLKADITGMLLGSKMNCFGNCLSKPLPSLHIVYNVMRQVFFN